MKLQRVELQELKGINKSSVEGVTQDAPTSLIGWEFTRSGGYTAGPPTQNVSESTSGIDETLIGFDDRGMIGTVDFSTSGDTLYLIRQDSSNVTHSSAVNLTQYAFIKNAGIAGRAQVSGPASGGGFNFQSGSYLVALEDGGTRGSLSPASGSDLFRVSSMSEKGGQLPSGSRVEVFGVRFVDTQGGKYVTDGTINSYITSSASKAVEVHWEEGTAISGSKFDVFARVRESSTDVETQYAYVETLESYSTSTISGKDVSSLTLPLGFVLGGQKGIAVPHQRRVYSRKSSVREDYIEEFDITMPGQQDRKPTVGSTAEFLAGLPASTIIYTEQQYANIIGPSNYFIPPFNVSTEVTALVSSPAGLLIFGDRETLLMRSDPALQDFQVQRVSGVVGHDSDNPPAVIGGMVFSVFDGGVYAINLGMGDVDFGSSLTKISQPFEGTDTFKSVWPNVKKRYILAKTEGDALSSTFYRYYLDHQKWSETSFTGADDDVIVPTTLDTGVRRVSTISYRDERASGTTGGGTNIDWEHLDLGDKNTEKLWRRAYVQMNDDFSGSVVMSYLPSTGSGGNLGVQELPGKRFVGTFPHGVVEEKLRRFRIRVDGEVVGDTVEPPITFEFVPRYRQRG